jgi:hypothetical protein
MPVRSACAIKLNADPNSLPVLDGEQVVDFPKKYWHKFLPTVRQNYGNGVRQSQTCVFRHYDQIDAHTVYSVLYCPQGSTPVTKYVVAIRNRTYVTVSAEGGRRVGPLLPKRVLLKVVALMRFKP